MVQRVKVQDGLIVYSSADPANEVEVDINGRLQVDTIVNVGTDPTLDGLVTTPGTGNLILSAGAGGNVNIKPTSGNIFINDIQWPDGSVPATPGMYIGVSANNVLQFMPGSGGGSTTLTATQVAYGSSTDTVTSSSTFTYDETTTTLSVGTPGSGIGYVSADSGQAIAVTSTSAVILQVGNNDVSLNAYGALHVNGSVGNAGHILTSAGPGMPVTWQAASGTVSLAATEIAFGSVAQTVSSSPDFTFDTTSGSLTIGGQASASIISKTTQTLNLVSDTSVKLSVNTQAFELSSTGSISINGTEGQSGYVLTSAGPGLPAEWQAASGVVTATQIAYGSSTNSLTSSSSFTYDDLTNTLTIGSTGAPVGYVSADPGQAISVSSDTGVLLQVGNHDIALNAHGAIDINGSAGSSGYILTSAGVGAPASWLPASGTVSLASTQVAFGSVANTVSSDSAFTYDSTSKTLSVGGNNSLVIDGNNATITSTTTNGNIMLLPNGTGSVVVGVIGDSSLGSEAGLSLYAASDLSISTNGNTRVRIKQNGSWELLSSAGQAGQVLTSNGNTSSPSWASIPAFVVNTIADLRNISSSLHSYAYVLGYYSPADGGGGMYALIPSDTTSVDNSGTIIVSNDSGRWKYTGFDGSISAKVFGVKADGTSDDTSALNKAIAWLSSIGGGQLLLPVGVISITGTVGVGVSSVSILGKGQGGMHDVPPASGIAATVIQWNGPLNGTMFNIAPTGNKSLRNCDFDGIYLRGNGANGMAAIGLNVLSCSESVHRVSGDSFTTTVVNYGCSNIVQEYSDCQHNDIWINAYQTTSSTGAMFICDGNAASGLVHGNFSMNRIHEISGNYYNTAVIMKDCDTNTLYSTRLFRMPGSTAVGMVLGSSSSVYYTCRSNLFIQLSCGDGGLYAEGTEINPHPSETNNILVYDLGNGSADPIIGTGATLWWSSTMAPIGMRDQPQTSSNFTRTRHSNGRISYNGSVTLNGSQSSTIAYSTPLTSSIISASVSSTTANNGSINPSLSSVTIVNNGNTSSTFYWSVEGI
jgi:hypothetical protein